MNRHRMISKYNFSEGNNVKYIVIHDTGNHKDTSKNNALYFNGGKVGASAHYFVDDNDVYQVVEDWNASWHCGDGGGRNGINNYNSIGIEMCNSGGYTSQKTIDNTIELTRQLMNAYIISIDNVVRHYDASGKRCPNNLSSNNWTGWWDFKARLKRSHENGGIITETPTIPSDAVATGVVKASSGLNMRTGTSTNTNKILTIPNGVKLPVFHFDGNWANVNYDNHNGWVSKDYLSVDMINKYEEDKKEGYIISNYLDIYTYANEHGNLFTKIKDLNDLISDLIPDDIDVFMTSNNSGYWFETQWMPIEKCNKLAKSLGELVSKIEIR